MASKTTSKSKSTSKKTTSTSNNSKAGKVISSAQAKAAEAAKNAKTSNTKTASDAKKKADAKTAAAKKSADKITNSTSSKVKATVKNANTKATNVSNAANKSATKTINDARTSANKTISSTKTANDKLYNDYLNSSAYKNAANAQNMTINDLGKKYGLDFSQDYADQQAETAAQAQRNIYNDRQRKNDSTNETALRRIQNSYDDAAGALDTNYFNQFMGQQQSQADRGLNAGIAANQNLQLGMNKQKEVGSLWKQTNTNRQEENMRFANENSAIYDGLTQVEAEKLINAKNIYQGLLGQGFNMLQGERSSAQQWANQNYGMVGDRMDNNNSMMNANLSNTYNYANLGVDNINNNANRQLDNIYKYTGMNVDNMNNTANRNLDTLNNTTNRYIDSINTYANNKINTNNTYTNQYLSNLSDYTKMNVNDIYDQMDRAEAAAARAAAARAARASTQRRSTGTTTTIQKTPLTPKKNDYNNVIVNQHRTPIESYNDRMKGSIVRKEPVMPYVTVRDNPNMTAWDKKRMLGL